MTAIMEKYIQYFRQAWNVIRQEKLFSFIYIAGTGLSITMVMALSIVFYIRIASIYPETNRDRLLHVSRCVEKNKTGNSVSSFYLSKNMIDACFSSLKNVEVTGIEAMSVTFDGVFVQPDGMKEQFPVTLKYVDENYWTIFPFRFVAGKPFTGADVQSGIRTAVIAESLARRLYGTADVAGRTVSINFDPYRICGIVKDASALTEAYAQVWTPYTLNPANSMFGTMNIGSLKLFLLADSRSSMKSVRQEVAENVRRYNQTLQDVEVNILGQPYSQWQNVLIEPSNDTPDFNRIRLRYALIFLVLLLIPAVSLSGMTHSRMERRMAEMGIRRAFGARTGGLMTQIITENLLFTLMGGAVGLASSYALVLLSREWITKIVGSTFFMPLSTGTETVLSPSMLLNLPVLFIALGICFLLNLMSSLIPAWSSSHREIVYSLNHKQ
jgi:putative ABC transport system permease protein